MLDETHDKAFGSITALACQVLGVPVALISILDEDRQYFKGHSGLPEPYRASRETPLSHSFCKHVVAHAAPLVINDARVHELVRENLAIRELGIIAYLGYPLYGGDGEPFGAFCAIDTKPREWSRKDIEITKALAAQVMSEVAIRLAAERREDQLEFMRMEESERVASNLADRHDLRTPLNAVSLGIQAVEMLGPLTADQLEYIRMAERNIGAVLSMIDQMLDSRHRTNRSPMEMTRKAVSPLELVARAVDQVASLAGQRNQSLTSRSGPLEPIVVDPDRIVRVLVNLLGNAIKFTPEGGSIGVSVRKYSQSTGQHSVLFSISDDGPGVVGEVREKIFEEGFRMDESAPIRHSAGLGLSFCRKVIEAHGGLIWVEANTAAGSCFQFYLPTP